MKDLYIFEDYETKLSTELSDYNDKPTFQRFFSEDSDERSEELSSTCIEGQNIESNRGKQTFEIDACTKDTKAAKPTSTILAYTEDVRATNTSTILVRTEDARANLSITTHSNQRSFACIGQKP